MVTATASIAMRRPLTNERRPAGVHGADAARLVRVLRVGVQHRRRGPAPKAIVEVIVFNGDGTLDVPSATVSLNGAIIRSPQSVGTYTVEDDCSGKIAFNGPTYDMFLSKDGDDISMIQTNPNTVFQGLATRTSRAVRDSNED